MCPRTVIVQILVHVVRPIIHRICDLDHVRRIEREEIDRMHPISRWHQDQICRARCTNRIDSGLRRSEPGGRSHTTADRLVHQSENHLRIACVVRSHFCPKISKHCVWLASRHTNCGAKVSTIVMWIDNRRKSLRGCICNYRIESRQFRRCDCPIDSGLHALPGEWYADYSQTF